MNYYIGIDVGGTNIKSSLVTENGEILEIAEVPSNSKASKDEILGNLFSVIQSEFDKMPEGSTLLGVGFGFPGPFDYENGISLMDASVSKYESIYGVNVKEHLVNAVLADEKMNKSLAEGFDILFENDAVAYALGQIILGNMTDCKTMCITIGTGTGSSAFINKKRLINEYGFGEDGLINQTPFRDSVIDDYVSARGIMNYYNSLNPEVKATNVKMISDKWHEKDEKAIEAMEYFGKTIAEALNVHFKVFPAECLIIGGQIAKSVPLYEKTLKENLCVNCKVIVSTDTSYSTILAAKQLFDQKK